MAIQPTWSNRAKQKLVEMRAEGKSYKEIAKVLRKSEGACESMMFRLENPATNRRGRPKTAKTAPSQELRDWFAGQALIGLCSNPNLLDLGKSVRLADCAYDIAQSMIEERTKRNEAKS